jgi:hypothetical protein
LNWSGVMPGCTKDGEMAAGRGGPQTGRFLDMVRRCDKTRFIDYAEARLRGPEEERWPYCCR